MVFLVAGPGDLPRQPRVPEARLLDGHPSPECDRCPHAGPRAEQHDPGHPRPPRPPDRPRGPLASGHRPCRHRHADGRRAEAPQGGKENPPRPRPRRVSQARLGVEGKARRHHHQPAQKARLLVRLGARAVHDGRSLLPQSAGDFCGPAQKGSHLPRQADGELVPGFAHRAQRRGSHPETAERLPLPF